MSPQTLTNLVLLQLAIEALLVILLLVIWRKFKSAVRRDPAGMPEKLRQSIENFLTESEKIAATFAANLTDKKKLSTDLILKLDRRLADYQALLKETEAGFEKASKQLGELKKRPGLPMPRPVPPAEANLEGKANPAAPEVRALVLKMAQKGHTPEEIAAKARLRLGEVELIIDLERQFNL